MAAERRLSNATLGRGPPLRERRSLRFGDDIAPARTAAEAGRLPDPSHAVTFPAAILEALAQRVLGLVATIADGSHTVGLGLIFPMPSNDLSP